MRKAIILIVFTLIIVETVTLHSRELKSSGAELSAVNNINAICETFDFHFLVVYNQQWTSKLRQINVFMDESEFSPENLIKMFRYISDQNPEPEGLTIKVVTNWEQLRKPSDCPSVMESEVPDDPNRYDYHQATFYRRFRGRTIEYFHYYPTLKSEDYKEIIMKGERVENR